MDKSTGGRGTAVLFKAAGEPLASDLYYQEGVQRGYDVRFVPVLSFRPGKDGREKLKECLEAVERYSGLVVTSQQAVHAVDDCGVTSDVLRAWVEGKKKLFGVGPQTSEKLEATFRSALSGDSTLSPPSALTAENGQQLAVVIIKEMEALGHDRLPLLYLCGNIRRDELPTALKEADIAFEELEVYETLASPSLPSDLAFGRRHAGGRGQRQVDWMCFFSPSGVKAIHEELHKPHGDVEDEEEERNGEGVSYGPRLAAIGPTTAKALIETFGVASSDAIAVASQPCALGLFDAIERHSSNSSTKQRP